MLVKRAPVWSMALKSGKKHFLSSLQPVTLQAAPSCLMTTLLCWEEVKPGCFLFLSTSLPPPPMETWPLTSCWSGHPKDSGPCTLMLRGTHLSPRPPSPQPDLLRSQSNPVTSSWGNLLRPWVLFPASRYLSGGAGVGRTTAVGCVCSSRVWLGSTPTCEANWDPGNLKAAWGVPVLVSCSELAPRQVPYLMPRPGWPTQ